MSSDFLVIKNDKEGIIILAENGLIINNVRQVGNTLNFERPIRISSSSVIGVCSVGAFSYIGAGSEIRNAHIGRFCSIAANVAIGPAEHPIEWLSSHPFQVDGIRYFDRYHEWSIFCQNNKKFSGNSAKTYIGHDTWIGRNAIIRQGVDVGPGCIIAAGAFVNKNIEPYMIAGGVPARVIRPRFPKSIVDRLLKIKWWEWEINPKLHEIEFDDVEATLNKLERLINENKLKLFQPSICSLKKISTENNYELSKS